MVGAAARVPARRELVPVARLRTRREGVLAGGAEIVDDSVAVLEGQHVARRFREVEVELLDGDERTLRRLEKELRKAGAAVDGRAAAEALSRARPRRDDRGPNEHEGHAARRGARRSRSRASTGSCSPTTRARGAATTRRTCTSCASRPGGCAHSSAPPGRSSTRNGPSRCAPSSAGSAAISGPARDLDVMLERLRSEVDALGDDGEGAAGFSGRSRRSGPPPTATSPRRSTATGTTRCSTGSKRRRRAAALGRDTR